MKTIIGKYIAGISLSLLISGAVLAAQLNPTKMKGLDYQLPLLEGNYDPAITTPSSMLGFPVGQKTATPAQVVEVVTSLTNQSDRAILVEYARSHEGRPLYYVVISTPENLARTDQVKADLARLSDPRGLSDAQAETLIAGLPAVAWMAFSIHGRETSGTDASMATIYHLVASMDEDVADLLDDMIVIIDPSQNPDGRARFTKAVEEVRGTAPNVDNQSMLHTQDWPGGRYNHYLFDLNRDYIHGIHPETRGKVSAINQWHPQIVIDAHEMSPLSSYHFSPFREPINVNSPDFHNKWNDVFAADQALAFDRMHWPYFNGENYDNLYPGYTSYSSFRGAINILYEQASISEDGVRQDQGLLVTYKEAVHHQLVSTMTNLATLAGRSKDLYRDYFTDRKFVLSSDGPYANRSFVVLPSQNRARIDAFVDLMEWQGFEFYQADKDINVSNATNQMGEKLGRTTIPAGSIVIPNRQPEARLVGTMLEFDSRMKPANLHKERELLMRGKRTIMYDVSAWNTTMLYGLDALTIPSHLKNNLSPYQAPVNDYGLKDVEHSIAWIVNGNDDHSVGFAARAMESGLKVRVVTLAAVLDGKSYPRGSVVVYRDDNWGFEGDLEQSIDALAREMHLTVQGFASGTGAGDLPDIGGRYFQILQQPSIALVTNGSTNPLDIGAIWQSVDRFLGIRHSQINQNWLTRMDLRRYNVIVLPDVRSQVLPDDVIGKLKTWVQNGGTLIAVKRSAAEITGADKELTRTRQLADTFEDIGKYDLALQREWLAEQNIMPDLAQINAHIVPDEVDYPWQAGAPAQKPDEMKKRDKWQSLFMPKGAFAAGRTDQEHWLTFGAGLVLPVLVGGVPILMADAGIDAAVRFGVYRKIENERWQEMQGDEDEDSPRKMGWASLPDQHELNLRMSGLIWPEAQQRLANAAYLTRESMGSGQIILFADSPMFRGSSLGTNRLLLNALVYGPGLGASQPIVP